MDKDGKESRVSHTLMSASQVNLTGPGKTQLKISVAQTEKTQTSCMKQL